MAFLDKWVLHPEFLPAWLQAATAIIALVISVWAVLWTGSAARWRDRLELRGVAVAIYPEIEMLKIATQTVREGVAHLRERYAGLVGQSVAASLDLTATIQVPPMLDRNIDRLFILGDVAGPSCIQLVRLIMQYNTMIERLVARVAILNAEQWVEASGHIDQHLALLDQVIEKCEHEIRPIHDSVRG